MLPEWNGEGNQLWGGDGGLGGEDFKTGPYGRDEI